jgi:RNA polymerase sigma-70 factor (ECF subfamily)
MYDPAVNDALSVARSAWPDVALSDETFAAWLAARSDASHLGDLYLACACVQGVDAALRAFEREVLSHLGAILGRLRPSNAFVEDVGQLLLEKLFTGASPKIREYSGRGPLLSWFRIVALRSAIDLKRARGEQVDRLDTGQTLVASVTSPELQALRNRYQPLFKSALAVAMAELTQEQRMILRMHYADGLTMEELAGLLKVGRTTIFRRVHACTRTLLTRVRAQLGAQLGTTTTEFESLAGALQDDLALGLSTLLGTED